MNPYRAAFPLTGDIVQLNHASFGIPTNRTLELAAQTRRELDADPTTALWPALAERTRAIAEDTAAWLGLAQGDLALTRNTTEAASAVAFSAPLTPDSVVVLLATEYPSVRRAWELATERAGARCVQVPLPAILGDPETVLETLDARVKGRVDYLQLSLITSATATVMPVPALSRWVRRRGGVLLLDAAHGAGHVPLGPLANHSATIFGSLHKWLPIPRGVGFLWAAPDLPWTIRPAEVSLSWDRDGLAERFAWSGTFDPTPRLCLADALEQWDEWSGAAALEEAAALADQASIELAGIAGVTPTAPPGMTPPRLRAAVLHDVPLAGLEQALDARQVRAWAGEHDGETIVRVATHVYTEAGDIDRLLDAVRAARG